MCLGLSTAWNGFRHNKAEELIFEIKSLGFQQIETGFNLTPAMVEEVAGISLAGGIKVLSVHNFCPIPAGLKREEALPDYYSLSALDEDQRRMAIRQSKNTIDTAKRLGARVMVLHCGRVEIPDETLGLIELYSALGNCATEFIKLRDKMIKEREDNAKAFLENALRSLEELNAYAERQNISLGIETRFYYREIPSFEETGIILKKFSRSRIFYWHDTGHGQVKENLRLERHKDYLDAYGKEIIGIHLHDISGCSDHKAPLTGEFDFSRLKPYIREDTLKIIEAHHPATAEELKASKAFLEELF